ncbi:hypothetical protein TrVE_jg12808 [Triparma verrucosa]|uniref:Uncharacterized protein n=2 Tax=Triparma TaxID=722752 RepID=A0A9W7BTK8_9STRA|nr:hypothetical protein TrST_g14206 [Triparma strigata]GMI05779.1 hypothetical protein TrVE_jg12808 [Triparma verrucosa]
MTSHEIKSVVIGEASTGKTSLSSYFCLGTTPTNPASTVGASFLQKRLPVDDQEVCLQIWDTAGQERFRALAPMYYRSAKAAVVVCDLSAPATYERLPTWLGDLRSFADETCAVIICGNKVDLLEGEDCDKAKSDLEKLAKEYNIPCMFTSAKTGENVDELFTSLARSAVENEAADVSGALLAAESKNDVVDLQEREEKEEGGGGCC